ncbi:putative pentatricopeptide repeat-containing protein [Vitis vinifera]|uniref:Putative pentatricopeptide repeat-containing protein n=1 Tax=Vitis vinifera TaxID=29760 RepID=A0A438EW07_VITVI|nr:putative pentatricopeptide repeat-containing protein [Vitis vinifera]
MVVSADEVQLNAATMVCLLSACSTLCNYGVGRFLLVFIDVNKIPLNAILVTALIDMYSKCGDVENAWRIFGGVSCKKLPPWNGYVQRGLFEEAIDLYYLTKAVYEISSSVPGSKQLRAKCDSCTVVVDMNAMILVLAYHGDGSDSFFSGFLTDGEDCMADKHGLSPKLEHFACMVDLLGQARHVKEAYELAHNTIIPPYSIIWGTLLSAGCIHRNLEPANTISGTEGGRMRRQVKGKRIKRPFGCSWVEVDGAVHRFVIEDTTHMKSMRDVEKAWRISDGISCIYLKILVGKTFERADLVASTANAHVEVTKEFWQPALMYHIKNVIAFNDTRERLGAVCVKGLYLVSLFTLGKGVLGKG